MSLMASSLPFKGHSNSSKCISTAQARKICVGAVGVCRDCALVVVLRVHFRTWWSLFVANGGEKSCFGGPKSTFRDRCKGSERLYLDACRFCGRRSTLDMVVIFETLCFRDKCNES